MKLLYYSFYLPALLKDNQQMVGGAAVQWKSWIRGFVDHGDSFGLLTFKGAKQYISKDLDFDVVESYDPSLGIKKIRLFYYQIPSLYKAIKKYKPDYLIQGAATAHTFIFLLLSKILGIPFVHRIASDADVDDRIYNIVADKKEIFLYRIGQKYSDIIFTQNSYQEKKLKEKYPNKKIFIIHNPYELVTSEKDILTRDKRKYVAWIGNFRKVKNLPALFQVAVELPEIQFKIAGSEHEDLDNDTKVTIQELKMLKNIEFVGYIKRGEIKTFLSHSVALLNTSFNEGFSNTFLEAWSLGVPVVTTKNVNPDDIVSDFGLGKVADDYKNLSGQLKILYNYNNEEFNSLAFLCYNYVKVNHNPKLLAQKFVSYLEKNF